MTDLRALNPILYDVTEHESRNVLLSMRNRISEELIKHRNLVKTKENILKILDMRLENG